MVQVQEGQADGESGVAGAREMEGRWVLVIVAVISWVPRPEVVVRVCREECDVVRDIFGGMFDWGWKMRA